MKTMRTVECGCIHLAQSSDHRWPFINRLKPNDPYMGRTAPLTSKRCILYIYSTNIGTEYFKHALYSPFFFLQNAVCFIMLTCSVHVLFTFYIQDVLKLKKKKIRRQRVKLINKSWGPIKCAEFADEPRSLFCGVT